MMLVSPLVLLVAMAIRSNKPKNTPLLSGPIMEHSVPTEPSDPELLCRAQDLFEDEKLLAAARILRRVRSPKSHLKEHHLKLLKVADIIEEAVDDFLAPPGEEWIKQGETHGDFDTSIFYKIENGGRLTCRIETPIPKDMLVPILAVWNESSLYETWIPSWKKPVRLGVRESKQILNDRKGHQVIQINCDVPWPMSQREVLMDVTAVDDIDATGCIIAKMQTLGTTSGKGTHHYLFPPGFQLPQLGKGAERVDFDGSILFRACPTDHPNYESARRKLGNDLILLQYTMYFDAKMAAVPTSLINFVTRVVIGMVWSMLLKVAEEVRSGERVEHVKMIQQKASFYQWLENRCHLLLDRKDVEVVHPASSIASLQQQSEQEGEDTMTGALRLAF